MQLSMLPPWKVRNRGFETHSGLQVLKKEKYFFPAHFIKIQYWGEPLWPGGSVFGLRPPGLECQILCLKGSVTSFISPSYTKIFQRVKGWHDHHLASGILPQKTCDVDPRLSLRWPTANGVDPALTRHCVSVWCLSGGGVPTRRQLLLSENTRRWLNAGLMMCGRHREPARESLTHCWINVGPASTTLAQHWSSIGWMSRVSAESQR